ncbi:hypothetical protein [Ectobacillus panaciterrae]|uniref:hypothetical protein n=1 Tax=Ectobacillus panaciterrae TaxID=363872 RepID=UPI0004062D9F|nr:hypothetical protein [Ectobacillus panaciterrae]
MKIFKVKLLILILGILIILFSLFVYKFNQAFVVKQDEIQVGHTIDDETQKVNDSTDVVKKGETVQIVVTYTKMVEKPSKQSAHLIMKKASTKEIVLEKVYEDSYGVSGYSTEFDTSTVEKGDYRLELHRDGKIVTAKVITLQ